MSLFTDPLGDGSFTRNWTVFYWLWWISYTPGVAMFVTRVSRGRKIKEVIWGLILGSTVGCWFFFGVMESYAIHQFINGVINVPQVLETLGGETAVQQVLMSLPAGKLFLAAYLGVMIISLPRIWMRWPTPWLRPVRVISRKVTILTVGCVFSGAW